MASTIYKGAIVLALVSAAGRSVFSEFLWSLVKVVPAETELKMTCRPLVSLFPSL